MLKQFILGVMGGLVIALGAAAYLGGSTVAIFGSLIGALLLAAAFVAVAYSGYGLFTDRVSLLPAAPTRGDLAGVGMTLLGNFLATTALGYLVLLVFEDTLAASAKALAMTKLAAPWHAVLLRAVLCGILLYLAFSILRERRSPIGILLLVPAFLLAGFEHAVTDMFYLAASGIDDWKELLFLVLALLGNAIGVLILPLLSSLTKDGEPAPEEPEDEASDEVAE